MEKAVSNKIKTTFLFWSMGDQLEHEIERYSNDKNKHLVQSESTLESEVTFLTKRIDLMESDMKNGKGKPYFNDIIQEMKVELDEKTKDLSQLKNIIQEENIPNSSIDTMKYDIQTIISLIESDVSDPQLLNQILLKYVSSILVQRETKIVHIILQITSGEAILFEKTVVVNLN